MSDLIDREKVINTVVGYFCELLGTETISEDSDLLYRLRNLTPAEPERKKGEWIQKSRPLDLCTEWWYECSECGAKPCRDCYGHPNHLSSFCPNCGADMRGE